MGTITIPKLAIGSTSIPCIGFGTATPTLEGSDESKQAILSATKLGYRHFDTAALYGTEQCLGEAIAEALSLGLIKSRDELFITSKLWMSDAHKDHVKLALQNSLRNLGLEFLDLYLIHWPIALKEPGNHSIFFNENNLVSLDIESVWEVMEECQTMGLTKFIGVSNFSYQKLQNLLAIAKIPPVNQVEMSPLWQQKKLRNFCKEKGILITTYSPLGAKGTVWGTNRVMECDALKQIAISKGKTIAQICLRWVYEQGVSFLVKSHDNNMIKENLDIYEWKLSLEELEKINQIPQEKACRARALNFIHENGPFKSEEELWDGDFQIIDV